MTTSLSPPKCKLCTERAQLSDKAALRENGWTIKRISLASSGIYELEACSKHSEEEIRELKNKIKDHSTKLSDRRKSKAKKIKLGEFA